MGEQPIFAVVEKVVAGPDKILHLATPNEVSSLHEKKYRFFKEILTKSNSHGGRNRRFSA